jgi:hypothetical protein
MRQLFFSSSCPACRQSVNTARRYEAFVLIRSEEATDGRVLDGADTILRRTVQVVHYLQAGACMFPPFPPFLSRRPPGRPRGELLSCSRRCLGPAAREVRRIPS